MLSEVSAVVEFEIGHDGGCRIRGRRVGKGRRARADALTGSTMVRLAHLLLRAGWLHGCIAGQVNLGRRLRCLCDGRVVQAATQSFSARGRGLGSNSRGMAAPRSTAAGSGFSSWVVCGARIQMEARRSFDGMAAVHCARWRRPDWPGK
jgi:hypothetical protein